VNVVDEIIRNARIAQAVRVIPPGARVLDVGCHDGALFRRLGPALREGLGLDPALRGPLAGERYRLQPGLFPADGPDEPGTFDVVTMLAVLEHLPPEEQKAAAEATHRLLTPGGLVIVTVPSPVVDHLLRWLTRLRVLDGMEAGQHHGFDPADVTPLMEAVGLRLVQHRRFELGLNHLFVLERPTHGDSVTPPE
jgi:SAM-dependent methyltransferase